MIIRSVDEPAETAVDEPINLLNLWKYIASIMNNKGVSIPLVNS